MNKQNLLLCAALCCSMSMAAQDRYSRVKIPVTSAQVKQFIFEQLHADHFEVENNSAEVVINEDELRRLQQSGLPFEMVTSDVVQETISINRTITPAESIVPFQPGGGCQRLSDIISVPLAFGTGGSLRLGAGSGNPGYFTYAEMIAEMQSLESVYPSLIDVFSIGTSANGNAIYAVKISDNVAANENEPEVLFTALQHAREAIGGTGMIFFMQYLLEHYAADPRIQALVNNRELYIVPCVNPDGYMYNYSGASASYPVTGGGLWRKNRRNTGGGAANIGVDLNRNYGIDWGNCSGASASCGSNVKTDDTYFGPNAFSEPESQAIRNFVLSRNFVAAIDQHCYGSYYSLPYGRPTLHPAFSPADSAFYTRIPALMGLYNGHRAGNSPQTVNYEVAGGIKDWLLMGEIGSGSGPKGKIFGMTGEAGGHNFWAPVSQIIPLCREISFQNIQLALSAGDFYEIEDRNDAAMQTSTGHFVFDCRRIGLFASAVTVTLVPIENILSVGPPVSFTLNDYNEVKTDSIAYTLSSQFVSGQRIRFAWQWEAGGVTHRDTIVKYFNPIVMIDEDMEGSVAANWNTAISPAGPAGWNFTTTAAYCGSKSLTESPSGNYTTNTTRTITYRNNINLGDALDAQLSFWVKHHAENFRDKLQVQVSVNGGSWSAICGTHTVRESNTTNGGSLGSEPALTGIREHWSHVLFDLEDYTGNANVSLRLQFTADGDGGSFAFERDEGFFIDNLKLIKVVNISTLPVRFLQAAARLHSNQSVRVEWVAQTDANHSHFEIERRVGESGPFVYIGRKEGPSPGYFIDGSPKIGMNYYRIRQVSRNGENYLSEIMGVQVMETRFTVGVYPNPIADKLRIGVTGMTLRENYHVVLMDPLGRVVLRSSKPSGPGTAVIELDVKSLPAQTYFLKLFNDRREKVLVQRVVKQ